jgi:hypothetical protein
VGEDDLANSSTAQNALRKAWMKMVFFSAQFTLWNVIAPVRPIWMMGHVTSKLAELISAKR